MTYKDELIVDGVVHAYDWSSSNQKNEYATEFTDGTYDRAGTVYSADGFELPESKFYRRQTADDLEGVLFDESPVDFGVYHHVGLTEFFDDGLVPAAPGLELRERHPERFAMFGFVDPLKDDFLADMERQVDEWDVDGFKIYPASYDSGDHVRIALDDPEFGRPVLEKARELGVTNIAVHKSVPAGPAPTQYFDVEDVDEAAAEFEDITFQIVHAGLAFLEETVMVAANFPNVYATLESTSSLVHTRPRQFAQMLGEFLYWAGPEKLVYASGCTLTHPAPLVEAIWDFEFPEDMKAEYGYPDFTDDMKRQIFGLNLLDILDVDPDDLREEIERNPKGTDEKQPAWSSVASD